MARYVGVAIAARQLGISRMVLQKLIRNGELLTFEGKVDIEDLRKSFPGLALNESPLIEKVEAIKETAYGNRLQEVVAPTIESLQSQIRRLKTELNVERHRARGYEFILNELLDKLAGMQIEANGMDRTVVRALNLWLLQRFDKQQD